MLFKGRKFGDDSQVRQYTISTNTILDRYEKRNNFWRGTNKWLIKRFVIDGYGQIELTIVHSVEMVVLKHNML